MKTETVEVLPRPDTPDVDLLTFGWVPVTERDGSPRLVGWRELFERGHELALASSDPLLTHSLVRLAVACGYLVNAYASQVSWQGVAAGDAFPDDGVQGMLGRVADHFWLYGPDRPFLQQPAVVAHMEPGSDSEFAALSAAVPSVSNPAWFNRAKSAELRPADADVAQTLLARHFCGLAGNQTANDVAGGRRSEGGATYLTNNGRTLVHWSASTFAATVACNLTAAGVRDIGVSNTLFWEAPTEPLRHVDDLLYLATATTDTTYVAEVAGELRAVRTPGLFAKEAGQALREAVKAADPFTMRVDGTTKAQPVRYIGFDADEHQHANIALFVQKVGSQGRLSLHSPSVLGSQQMQVRGRRRGDAQVVATIVGGAGSSTGPAIASVVSQPVNDQLLTLDDPERWKALQRLVSQVGGQSRSLVTLTRHHVRAAAAGANAGPNALAGVGPQVRSGIWAAAEPVMSRLLEHIVHGDAPPTELSEQDARALLDAALSVFDLCMRPYAASYRHQPAIIVHRRQLRIALWKTLSPNMS